MRMGSGILLGVFGLLFVLASCNAQTINSTYYKEGCWYAVPCHSLISYFAQGETLGDIAKLFNVDFLEIMGANNLDVMKADTLKTSKVANGTLVLVPQPCECLSSGSPATGANVYRTNRTVYTVKAGDFLSKISDQYFGGLTTYQVIADANQIEDVDQVFPEQELVIPFMCTCPNITAPNPFARGLTYQVQKGDDLTKIASTFATTEKTLQTYNNITNSSSLVEKQLVRVPLAGCAASFTGGAQDTNLVVSGGAYNLTYGDTNCVQCKCYREGSEKVPSMHCVPNPAREEAKCPNLECTTDLFIGNFTTQPGVGNTCDVTSCTYGGYINMGKVEKITLQSKGLATCPAHTAAPAYNELGTIPGSSTTPGASPGTPGGSSPAGDGKSRATSLRPQSLLFSAASVVISVLLFTR